jgi:1-acyl-sn-glycerol-3-phosphate acyltransferase
MVHPYFHPLNIKVIEGFRAYARDHTLSQSMAWLLEQFNVRNEVKSGAFPPAGPQIVIMNHHGAFDGLLLISLIPRDDVYFVGLYGLTDLSEEVAARLLPVYFAYKPSPHLFNRLKNRFYHPLREGVGRDEVWRRNTETVQRASRVLNEGAVVIIAPTGGDFERLSEWQAGLGHIIKGVRRDDVSIVFTRVLGSRRRDGLRFLNPHLFRFGDKTTETTVEIAEPIPATAFKASGKPAARISMEIRDRYLETFGTLGR